MAGDANLGGDSPQAKFTRDTKSQAKARAQFEKQFAAAIKHLEEQIEASRECERLTAEDFNIRINAKG